MAMRLAVVAALLALAGTATAGGPVRHSDTETRLIRALTELRAGRHERAGETLRSLVADRPDFALARFLHAEWLHMRAGGHVAAAADGKASDLLAEARLRWRHHRNPPPAGGIPDALLRLAPADRHAIVVDLSAHRLYLFRNEGGRVRLQADYYASIGSAGVGKLFEGDHRTPVGIYRIDGFEPDARLPERYGRGALTLNYPNAWDRFFGRTGHGIWVHGVPRDTYARPPLTSEGCVVVANDDLDRLRASVRPGHTPVVFTDELEWLTPDEALARQREILVGLREWQRSRAAGDAGAAAALYADTYNPGAGGGRPHRTAAGGDAPLDHVSVFAYPGEPNLRMTTFALPGTAGETALFWRRQSDNRWRIVHQALR